MQVVMFLSKLRKSVEPEEYEQWVRSFDYEVTKSMSSVSYYRVHKVKEKLQGDAPYDYIEYITINDYEKYKKEIYGETGETILAQWRNYIEKSDVVYCETIEP